jgi:serine phosphatase RsbU (regulator of sigma subunit)
MAVSKALCKSARLRMPDATIGEWLRAANVEISRDNPEMLFVTAFAGTLDLDTGRLSCANAGHENPYTVNRAPAGLAALDGGGGPPLCAVERFDYRDAAHAMRAGELLCVVTDGVVDAQDLDGRRYGRERLEALLARVAATAPATQAVVDALRADIDAFAAGAEPADDVTVLVLRWPGPPQAA